MQTFKEGKLIPIVASVAVVPTTTQSNECQRKHEDHTHDDQHHGQAGAGAAAAAALLLRLLRGDRRVIRREVAFAGGST